MKLSIIIGALLVSSFAACSRAPSEERLGSGAAAAAVAEPGRVTVMTHNIYWGVHLDPILAAQSPEEIPVLVANAWAELESNAPSVRARAIAVEIKQNKPALVGLQEAAIFRRFPASGDAPEVVDMLADIQSGLEAGGLDYRLVITQDDSHVWMPLLAGIDANGAPILDLVEMLDREAILVRGDVETSNATSGRYVQDLPLSVGGEPVSIVSGWASVVASTDTGPLRFVSTHLDATSPDVQMAQAYELMELLGPETLPLIVVGDFNSAAGGTSTPTYGLMTKARYTDVWRRANPRDPGFTCCGPIDLHAPATLTERIDFVFAREHGRSVKGLVTAKIVGTSKFEGIWPSDHAGVVASFRMP